MKTQNSLDETRIADVSRNFQPRPGLKAYQRMAQAPWRIPGKGAHQRHALGAAVLLIIALVTLVWVTPPLRAVAQDILDQLFKRAATQVVSWELASEPGTPVPKSVAETFLSVAAAEARTGLDIREPDSALVPYPLTGITVNYALDTVWLIYADANGYLSIYQRAAERGWLDEGLVGQSAGIVKVTIQYVTGEIAVGEYVQGGWTLEGTVTPTGNNTDQVPSAWTTRTSQQRLRWRDQVYVYEMMTLSPSLRMADMTKIAASMR